MCSACPAGRARELREGWTRACWDLHAPSSAPSPYSVLSEYVWNRTGGPSCCPRYPSGWACPPEHFSSLVAAFHPSLLLITRIECPRGRAGEGRKLWKPLGLHGFWLQPSQVLATCHMQGPGLPQAAASPGALLALLPSPRVPGSLCPHADLTCRALYLSALSHGWMVTFQVALQ